MLSTVLGFGVGFFYPTASVPGANQGMEMEGMNLFQKHLLQQEVQLVAAGI